MNKFIKNTVALFTAILTVLGLCLTATAEETEATLFNNNKEQDIAVFIEYEKNDITFKLISPSGAEITKATDTDNITVYSGSTSTIVFLGNAEAGEWKIKYDKGSNESITVHASSQDSTFWITSYTTGEITGEEMPVTFTVTGSNNTRYNYSLILTTDTKSLDGKTLSSGYASVDEEVSINVPLEEVSSYSGYHLLLYVSYTDDNSEIFDYAYSEAFDYTNVNSPEVLKDIDFTISHDSGLITADWSEHIDRNISSVFVEYYINDKLISSTEYPVSEGKEGYFSFSSEADAPSLKISLKNHDGLVSDYAKFDVPISSDDSLKLTLPESGKVGSEIWSFDYDNADNTEVTFDINGNREAYTLDGNGSKYITLPDERNTIIVTYEDALGNVHEYNRTANISIASPTLELLNSIDGVTTRNDSIIISGKTNAASLTVNGTEIEVENGNFVYKYELENGNNSIVISASTGDSTTSLTATVTKEDDGVFSSKSEGIGAFLPLIAGLIISAAGIVLIIVLSKKAKTNKTKADKTKADKVKTVKIKADKPKKFRKPGHTLLILSVIFWLLTVVLWIWFIVRKIFENGTGFIELAHESLKNADSYLTHTTIILIVAIAVTVIAVILTIIFVIIRITKNPNRPTKQMTLQDYGNQQNFNVQQNFANQQNFNSQQNFANQPQFNPEYNVNQQSYQPDTKPSEQNNQNG